MPFTSRYTLQTSFAKVETTRAVTVVGLVCLLAVSWIRMGIWYGMPIMHPVSENLISLYVSKFALYITASR